MPTRLMPRAVLVSSLIFSLCAGLTARAELPPESVQVQKIWDKGNHNAFTDLLFHDGKWFCVFREGQGHVSPDGALRVLTSTDGKDWTSAALITMPEIDLRDAKISVSPQGKLVLCGAGVTQPPVEKSHQSYLWYSDNGTDWGTPIPIGDKNYWIWRIVWHKGAAYGIGYKTSTTDDKHIRLYKSTDGKTFETLVSNMGVGGYPNETALTFQKDGTALCALRLDIKGDSSALLGTAKAPYTDWKWDSLGVRIGGPQMLELADGRYVVSGRHYPSGGAKTKIWFLDPEKKELTDIVTLPSGGDTSYPGLVEKDGLLWVSYYSSHEGKTNIYLAQVKLP